MAEDKLQYTLEVVDKATETLKKVQKELEDLQDKTDKAGDALQKNAKKNESLTASFIKADIAITALKRGFGFLENQVQESLAAANDYQRSLVGLNSTAAAFGESQDKARQAAQRLASDGLLTAADASKSLQNLLTTGIGLDKAEQLMSAYKDQAALGRAQNISFSQAVSNLAESFMTESSAVGNLSGQSENYNQILARGAAMMGKNVQSLNDAERAQAKYLGTMELAKVVHGDLALYLQTADAQMQVFQNTVNNLHILFGQALSPAVMYATQMLSDMAQAADGSASPALNNIAKALVYLVGLARVTGKIFVEMGQAIAESLKGPQIMIEKAMKGDYLAAITDPWKNTFNSFKGAAVDITAEVDKVSQEIGNINSKIDKDGLGSFGNIFKDKAQFAADAVGKAGKDIADKLKKIGEDISTELDNYARTSADKISSFQDSLRELVIQHRAAISDLQSQIQGLNSDFASADQDRADAHASKRDEIMQKYDDETKTLKENLARQLTATKGSDAQLIAYFQAQIAEKEKQRDEELRNEDDQYAKEEAKQKASFDKQLTALQTKLNAELDIQKQHQAEFDQYKDAVEQDDITRLQQNFEKEMAELKRQHDDRMAELRKEQEEILAIKATTAADAAKKVQQAAQTRAVSISAPAANVMVSDPKNDVVAASALQWISMPKYHDGGVIPGSGEVPILAKGGETVLTQRQSESLMTLLTKLGSAGQGTAPGMQQTNNYNIYNQVDLVGALREAGWRMRLR